MANERKDQDQDLETPEVAELEDKDLDEASGGGANAGLDQLAPGNYNCGC